MSYLAGRAAPLGVVGAGAVSAAFYSFNPDLVAELVPRIWRLTAPDRILPLRLLIVDACLRRLLGPGTLASPELAEAAELAWSAALGCRRPGRPMFSANADLPVPEAAHLKLWHAATLLREHRGDGHIAMLLQAGLDGVEALVTDTATGNNWKPGFLQAQRGWTAEQWAAACDRLRERGLLDGQGELTEGGLALRRDLEDATDRLNAEPYYALGAAGTRRLTELAGALSKRVLAAGALPLQHFGKR